MLLKFRKCRVKTPLGKIAIGSIGRGIKRAQTSVILDNLKKLGISYTPYELIVPDVSQKMQNSIAATYAFPLIKDDLKKMGEKVFKGKDIAGLVGASGGGNGEVACLATGINCDFPGQFKVLSFYISEGAVPRYSGNLKSCRRKINTYIQLATLGRQMRKMSTLNLELFTMPTLLESYGHSYEKIDNNIFQSETIISGTEKFGDIRGSIVEILGRPEFQFFTIGYYETSLKDRPEVMAARIRDIVKFELKPFFEPNLIFNEPEKNIVQNPVVFVAGKPDAVEDTWKIFNAELIELKNQSYKIGAKEYDILFSDTADLAYELQREEGVGIKDLYTWPIEHSQKLYFAAIFPLKKQWIMKVLEEAKERLIEIKNEADSQRDTLFGKTYESMKNQAGGDRLLWEILED